MLNYRLGATPRDGPVREKRLKKYLYAQLISRPCLLQIKKNKVEKETNYFEKVFENQGSYVFVVKL